MVSHFAPMSFICLHITNCYQQVCPQDGSNVLTMPILVWHHCDTCPVEWGGIVTGQGSNLKHPKVESRFREKWLKTDSSVKSVKLYLINKMYELE